jgi:hypothetical protein
MSIILTEKRVKDSMPMRDSYVKTLTEVALQNPDIVALDADLASCMGGGGREWRSRASRQLRDPGGQHDGRRGRPFRRR